MEAPRASWMKISAVASKTIFFRNGWGRKMSQCPRMNRGLVLMVRMPSRQKNDWASMPWKMPISFLKSETRSPPRRPWIQTAMKAITARFLIQRRGSTASVETVRIIVIRPIPEAMSRWRCS